MSVLILSSSNISWNQFATIMSDLFAVTSKAIHFPSGVQNVTNNEIIQVFEDEFRFTDATQKGCLEILISEL